MLSGARGAQLWNYWKEQLAGELPVLDLPANRTRPLTQSYQGRSFSFKLSAELTKSIKQLARSQNATLFITLLAAFQALLSQGWVDALRKRHPEATVYTFWDYMRNRWPRDAGLRLDHLLLSKKTARRLLDAGVDRAVRGEENASDHAPVWVVLKD